MLSKRLMTSACAAAMLLTMSATPALAQGGPWIHALSSRSTSRSSCRA